MVVKRGRKKATFEETSDDYEQAMLAEGAPVALDLLGLGSTIDECIASKPRKAAKKRRAKKIARAKAKSPRIKKKKRAARKTRRRT